MRSPRLNNHGDYPALLASVPRKVRFGEVDSMQVMWHGRYPSFLEDGREALGAKYGVSYTDFLAHGVVVPIKRLEIDYIQPLRYGQTYHINTSLIWTDSARLDFAYTITDADGQVMTKAHTVQLLVTMQGELLLEVPEFYARFKARWQKGELA